MVKTPKSFRLSSESLEQLKLLKAIYVEMQQSNFKNIKLSDADILEKIIHDHYASLMLQLDKNFIQTVKEKTMSQK